MSIYNTLEPLPIKSKDVIEHLNSDEIVEPEKKSKIDKQVSMANNCDNHSEESEPNGGAPDVIQLDHEVKADVKCNPVEQGQVIEILSI